MEKTHACVVLYGGLIKQWEAEALRRLSAAFEMLGEPDECSLQYRTCGLHGKIGPPTQCTSNWTFESNKLDGQGALQEQHTAWVFQ